MNTYTFTKDHKNITLAPLKSTSLSKPKDKPQMDVFLTTLLKSQMHECEPYKEWILLGHELALATASTHPLLEPLLQAFKRVFPQEIPMTYLQNDLYNTKLALFLVLHSQTNQPIG